MEKEASEPLTTKSSLVSLMLFVCLYTLVIEVDSHSIFFVRCTNGRLDEEHRPFWSILNLYVALSANLL